MLFHVTVLALVILKAEPEGKAWAQVVYLRSNSRESYGEVRQENKIQACIFELVSL